MLSIAFMIAAAVQGWGGSQPQGWAPAPGRETREGTSGHCPLVTSANAGSSASGGGGHLGGTGLANRFQVQVNGVDLGSWQKLDETPGEAKLARAASGESAAARQALQQWQNKAPALVVITLLDATGNPTQQQTLVGATPKSWSVNSMDAGASAVAVETLELNFTSIRC